VLQSSVGLGCLLAPVISITLRVPLGDIAVEVLANPQTRTQPRGIFFLQNCGFPTNVTSSWLMTFFTFTVDGSVLYKSLGGKDGTEEDHHAAALCVNGRVGSKENWYSSDYVLHSRTQSPLHLQMLP